MKAAETTAQNCSYPQFPLLEIDHKSFEQALEIRPKHNLVPALRGEFLLQIFQLMELVAKDLSIAVLIVSAPSSVFGAHTAVELERQDYADLYNMLLKINHLALLMPQLIVRDFGAGASDLALDFLCTADIKIAKSRSHLNFDHLSKGLTPASFTLGSLAGAGGSSLLQQWFYSSRAVETQELLQRGLVSDSYENSGTRSALLQGLVERINSQSATARMQFKRMVQENLRLSGEHLRTELAVIKANLSVGDYLLYARATALQERPAFVDPDDLKKILQVSSSA